jgi:type I thyroxine 5'-deiodinase
LPVNIKDEVVYDSPKSFEERSGVATACVRKLGLRIPALIDHLDDSTEEAYIGWPDRLYVIGRDGRVAYKSRPGPFGFKPAELEEALRGSH